MSDYLPLNTLLVTHYLLTALLLLTGWSLSAQIVLTGQLTDAAEGTPVSFATVYLEGTSVGDVSGDDGRFRINVPAGMAQSTLVVSHLNYNTEMLPLPEGKTSFAFQLIPKAAELTSIEVEDSDRRQANLREFRKAIVGTDEWGLRVEIRNYEVLSFTRDTRERTIRNVDTDMAAILRGRNLRDEVWSDDGSTLTYAEPINLQATTSDALRVHLKDLGYELYIDLVGFKNDYQSRQVSYLSANYFTPVKGASRKQQRRYERNRKKAYYGSSLNFIRSLIADSLSENGFQVVEVLREPSSSRQQEIRPVDLRSHLRQNKEGNYLLMDLSENQYAILYHGRHRVPGADPVLNSSANILQSRMLLVGLSALILPDGTLGDTNLIFSGDIGKRKLAWSLPSDYYPPVD